MSLKKSLATLILSLAFLIVSSADPGMILVTKEFEGDFTDSSDSGAGWLVNGKQVTP